MEVGSHSPWTSRFFNELGHEVLVGNPRKVRVISANERKCDELDAMMLARLGRVDPELLYPIQHGTEQSQRDFLQIKLRDNLVRQRVDIISSVRFTLKSLGLKISSPSAACFPKHARAQLSEIDTALLEMVEPSLQVIELLTKQIKSFEQRIESLSVESYPETLRLRQIVGIGPIMALTFVLVIGDKERFEKSRDVGAYLGMVPKRDQSGNLDKELRTSKAGDAYLRRLWVSAAQYVLGPFGPPCDLRSHGLKLAGRGGRGAKKKAVIAIARKLAVIMHTLWTRECDYEPARQRI